MKTKTLIASLIGVIALTAPLSIQAQILVNGGFEHPDALFGWSGTGNVVIADQAAAALYLSLQPVEGAWLAVFNGGDTAPSGILRQSFQTIPGATYQLSYSVGRGGSGGGSIGILTQAAVGQGGGVLAEQTISVGSLGWAPVATLEFTALTSDSVIHFWDVSSSTDGVDLVLDAVSVNLTAVPEPSEYALAAGVALVGFGAWRRRRQPLAP